ncbi:anti-sigma regulatory factor (Ser/Thr protein kinase) [Streptomyces sp. B3I7]|uniref:sensor histidine kinase n=1 Tax=Streptomyces sp. B3I7 TaxID=3042269 RepID=UPI002789026F|nr:nitrate- and nitrite sensing domain-containing protein [Streptomyces sp. B3I7]MDQ0814563.1 anti-sigma regulatory factor (Ser/Thr protein kinase) [Streptomyces sp. B3I7]
MRFRGKSIRRKIVALLLVPLLALTAVWGYASVLMGREVLQLFHVSSVVEKIAYPTEDAVRALEQERRQTLIYLADPRASDALGALRRTRIATDDALATLRGNVKTSKVRDALDTDDSADLTTVLDGFRSVDSVRESVDGSNLTRARALDLYNRVVDPCYALLATLDVVDTTELDKQYRALVNAARARELFSREDALLGSALVTGRVTRTELRDISELIAQRGAVYEVSTDQLPAEERDRYDNFWQGAPTASLREAEKFVQNTDPDEMPPGVTAKSWDSLGGHVLDRLAALDDAAADRYQDRVHPAAVGTITEAAVVGVLGLIALVFSVVLSVRVGSGLVRDLRRLRQEAHEASGVRLPGVLRRLSAGEQVDVETEVPRLEFEKNEIGEVGQALNTLQRAAVEGAVRQAELRAGISEVFVNLARRSQVLLHKQLTLLDTMERRTEDTDELADLFRLDHLTTRMRRHAEGLVILSGAAPSRQWRKPIQLMDVVRAAVAEVEDYERIEVRRLPRVAVTGPAVADLTHLVAELLENATVFSPPHTAVQVIGERVPNGFTLEIHDRGLGMAAEALLDANLRLAETPEFELSDTDRLGLFVVSRLAQRQNIRVSLQPSPYGGITAVVLIPDTLLTDDIPDTNGTGFRLDRLSGKKARGGAGRDSALGRVPGDPPGLPTPVLDGPVELEAPVDLDALAGFPDVLAGEDGHRGLFGPRRSLTGVPDEQHTRETRDARDEPTAHGDPTRSDGPVPLPRRHTPKLVSSHGRPVPDNRARRGGWDQEPSEARAHGDATDAGRMHDDRPHEDRPDENRPHDDRSGTGRRRTDGRDTDRRNTSLVRGDRSDGSYRGDRGDTGRPRADRWAPGSGAADPTPGTPDPTPRIGPATGQAESGAGPLPRRVRQASLAPQLRQGPDTRPGGTHAADPADRDADEVRSRMASLQRGWQRGRHENAAGDEGPDGSAPGTTEGDGR